MNQRICTALAFTLASSLSIGLAQSSGSMGTGSSDADASTLVLDGIRARHITAGVETASTAISNQPAAGSCANATANFVLNASGQEGDTPSAAAFTPDATRIVVAHMSTKNLIVFDANTRAVLHVVQLSGTPNDVAISSDNVHAVTANIWENTASIVDLSTGLEVAVVPVGAQPACVRCTPNGLTAVVGNSVDESLSVIDIATATELHRIAGAGFASTTTISFEPGVVTYKINGFECPSDTLAVHPDNQNAQIDFFDLAAGTVTSVPCDLQPRGIAMTPNGSKIVISHYFGVHKLTVVDPATKTISKVITSTLDFDEPIAISPDGAKAAVSLQNASAIVDLATGVASASVNTASVNRMLSTPDGQYALAVGFVGSLISYSTGASVNSLNNSVSTYVGAMAPSGHRAAMIANHNAEDMLVVDVNGAAGFLEANVSSGPPPDADATRNVAISLDGKRAVTTNILSHNASVIDVATGSVLAVVPVGTRPAGVAITPDRSKAVVTNLDSTFASVIDLTTFSSTPVAISTRGCQVAISPDGHYAYVLVATADGVWRIDLTTNTVAGAKLATADVGNTFFLFMPESGLTLSHDGKTLAVCGSFTNQVTVIDTASWSVAATVSVGTFPFRAVFAPDDSALYVSNDNSNSVSVLKHPGGAWSVSNTIAVGQGPFELAVDATNSKLYVANFTSGNVGFVDLATGTMTNTVKVPDSPQAIALSPSGSCLYAASGTWSVSVGPGPKMSIAHSGAISVIDTATHAVVQSFDTKLPPAAMAFDLSGTVGLVPSPFGDGLTRIEVPAPVSTYCTSKTNSNGCTPAIAFSGSPSASAGSGFVISTSQVLPHVNGLFFYSIVGANGVPFQGGFLCVQSPIHRTAILNSGGTIACGGAYQFDFNTYIASGVDPALIAGVKFWGQYWSRDPASASTTNLTDAITGAIGP